MTPAEINAMTQAAVARATAQAAADLEAQRIRNALPVTAPPPTAVPPRQPVVNRFDPTMKARMIDAAKSGTVLMRDESLSGQARTKAEGEAEASGESWLDKLGGALGKINLPNLSFGGGGAQPITVTTSGAQEQGPGFDPTLLLILGGLGLAAVLLASR